MKSYQKGIGYRYLLKTKYYPDRPFIDDLGRIESPPLYKVYPEAPRIALPKQFDFTLPEFTSIIASRRSHRHFKPASLLCQNWPSCSGRAKVLPRLKVTALPPRLGPSIRWKPISPFTGSRMCLRVFITLMFGISVWKD